MSAAFSSRRVKELQPLFCKKETELLDTLSVQSRSWCQETQRGSEDDKKFFQGDIHSKPLKKSKTGSDITAVQNSNLINQLVHKSGEELTIADAPLLHSGGPYLTGDAQSPTSIVEVHDLVFHVALDWLADASISTA